jgi:hypothetical protein
MRPLLLASALLATPAAAQTAEDEQAWLNLTIAGRAAGKALYMVDIQPRFGDGVSRLDTLIVRPAIGWQLSPRVSVYQGYAYVLNPVDTGRDRREQRSFQQLFWLVRPGATEVLTRVRLEQRFSSAGGETGWRARGWLRAETPLGRGPVKALGWVEGFAHLNTTAWSARKGFDQVRVFAGVEVPVQGRTTVEAGYLNQAINDPGGRSRVRHAASLTLFVRP